MTFWPACSQLQDEFNDINMSLMTFWRVMPFWQWTIEIINRANIISFNEFQYLVHVPSPNKVRAILGHTKDHNVHWTVELMLGRLCWWWLNLRWRVDMWGGNSVIRLIADSLQIVEAVIDLSIEGRQSTIHVPHSWLQRLFHCWHVTSLWARRNQCFNRHRQFFDRLLQLCICLPNINSIRTAFIQNERRQTVLLLCRFNSRTACDHNVTLLFISHFSLFNRQLAG